MTEYRPTVGFVTAIRSSAGVVTSGFVEDEQELIYYRIGANTPGGKQVFEWVKPSHARPWPVGLRGMIRSASVGDIVAIGWVNVNETEARFHISESLPTPDECGAPPAAIQPNPNEFVEAS